MKIISFPRPQRPPEPRRFGTVKARRKRLYVRFRYFCHTVEKAAGLPDTAQNRRQVRAFLDRIGLAIEERRFRFAEVFPGASDDEKERFSRLEGWQYKKMPADLTLSDYIEQWIPQHLERDPSMTKRRDYLSAINTHIGPHFGCLTFAEITGVEIVDWLRTLQHLSGSRIRNIMIPLRVIWEDAVEEYAWDLRNPFEHVKRRNRNAQLIPKRQKNPPEVFRFQEWLAIIEAIDLWYRPICDLQLRTGATASEIQQITLADIADGMLQIHGTKNRYRERAFPITEALQKTLRQLSDRCSGDRLITRPDGRDFSAVRFRNGPWRRVFSKTEIRYRRPYAMRHTFAAWSLRIGLHPDRVVELMGHGSRQMIWEVYGLKARGLDEDTKQLRCYMGEDFQ